MFIAGFIGLCPDRSGKALWRIRKDALECLLKDDFMKNQNRTDFSFLCRNDNRFVKK